MCARIPTVDNAEESRSKQQEQQTEEAEDDRSRLDILDDPVRMYMSQMGKVPLLTREQEVEICQRIEAAELEMKRIIYSFGFAAKEPATAIMKMIGGYRPIMITTAVDRLYQSVLAFSPAKADPLLAAELVNA